MKLEQDVSGPLAVTLEVPKEPLGAGLISGHATPESGSGLTRLRLRFSRTMPPGSYRGYAEIDSEKKAIEVEVQPRWRLKVLPRQSYVEASPGDRVAVRLSLANLGNVPCKVPRASAFGLFPLRGMDRSDRQRLERRAQTRREERRPLPRGAPETHGGTVVCQIRGAGVLKPGEVHELDIELRLPSRLRAGRSYRGMLAFDHLKHRVEIQVTPATKKPKPGAKRTGERKS